MNKFHIIILFMLIPVIAQVHAQYSETEVKAAFLERFTRFIEWPLVENVDSKYFIIGVLDGETTEKIFSSLYAEQLIKEKPVKIININSKNEFEKLGSCHIIYITDKWSKEIDAIFKNTNGKPILLVGESDMHFHYGVMINFYTDDNHLRFRINPDLMGKAGFQVDYRLLDYASIKSN